MEKDYVGTIFRSWALLGRILHFLLRLLLLLVVLNAFWVVPGSIFEGPGRILETPNPYFSVLLSTSSHAL